MCATQNFRRGLRTFFREENSDLLVVGVLRLAPVNARHDALLFRSHIFAFSGVETQAKNNDHPFVKMSHVTAAARTKRKEKTAQGESGVGDAQRKRCKKRDRQAQKIFLDS